MGFSKKLCCITRKVRVHKKKNRKVFFEDSLPKFITVVTCQKNRVMVMKFFFPKAPDSSDVQLSSSRDVR